MHVTLEYLAIGVMLVLFISVAFNVVNDVVKQLEHVREEQLYTVAERIMDKILLTPGYPLDWGRDFTNEITDFGLALYGARSPYELDPDKVMRLANLTTLPNPLLVNSTEIAELLGIKDEYGFCLEMHPLLSHEVEVLDHYPTPGAITPDLPSRINVSLFNWYGVRVPGANVTGIYVLTRVWPGSEEIDYEVLVESCVTNARGFCILDYEDELKDYFSTTPPGHAHWYSAFIILHTNWYGFVAVDGYTEPPEPGAPVTGYIIGDYIFINRTVEGLEGAIITRDEVLQALPEYAGLLQITSIEWLNETETPLGAVIPSSEDYAVGRIEYIEKLSSHVFVFGKWRGSPIVVVIDRLPHIDIAYSTHEARPANMVTLTRIAHLYNYPYIVKVSIWRLVEGWP